MAIQPANIPIHVVPVDDTKPHDHSHLYQCACGPVLEVSHNVFIVIHHAYDGRE